MSFQLLKIIWVLISIFFTLMSCDPIDKRLSIENDSENEIILRASFIQNDTIIETSLDMVRIGANSKISLVKLWSWDSEFSRLKTRVPLSITAYESRNLDVKDLSSPEAFNKVDSLIRKGEYFISNFSLDQLKNANWNILFPEDFERGKSLSLNSGSNFMTN